MKRADAIDSTPATAAEISPSLTAWTSLEGLSRGPRSRSRDDAFGLPIRGSGVTVRRLLRAVAACCLFSIGSGSRALAGNDSNYLALLNGVDLFYGGAYHPQNPPANFTHGIWRCFPAETLHAPTKVIDPQDPLFGSYATKVTALRFAAAQTGVVAQWPTIALSSGDADCRAVVGGGLNFGFASSTTLGGTNAGWFAVGPTSGSQVNLLALATNVSASVPATTTGGFFEFVLSLASGGPSAIRVPEGHSLTMWIANDLSQGPGQYQYYVGSDDEGGVCSSLSFFASAVHSVGSSLQGAVFGSPKQREWGMFVGTLDATLQIATSTVPAYSSASPIGTANPAYLGTAGLSISLGSGSTAVTFVTYDCNNAFGGSSKLVVGNLMAVNTFGVQSCGPWSPGYAALSTGGPGGPVLLSSLPQQPRLVARLDLLAISLLQNPQWLLATTHQVIPGGGSQPMFGGTFPGIAGSTGNTGGAAILVPALPELVGTQLFFCEINLDPTGQSLAVFSNNGHSNSNGFPILFFP